MSPPPAHSVSPKGDDEVELQKTFPDQVEVPEIVGAVPQDDSSVAGHTGEKSLMGTDDGGRVPLGPKQDTTPEIYTALESSNHSSRKGGGVPAPPVTSAQPEASDNLLEALRGASIVDEHRIYGYGD